MINLENEISFDPKSLPEPVCISWIVTSYLQARIVSNWYFLCHLLWGSMNRAIETKADNEDPPIHNKSGSRNINTEGPRYEGNQPDFIWSATVTPPTLNLLEPDQGICNTRKLSLPRKETFRLTLWSQLWECHLISTLRMSPDFNFKNVTCRPSAPCRSWSSGARRETPPAASGSQWNARRATPSL